MAESALESTTWCLAAAIVVCVLETSLLWWAYQRTLGDHLNKLSPAIDDRDTVRQPQSVNYHFTRQCNYQCGFCFHTAKTSFVLPIEEAKRGLKLLKEAGTH